MGGKMGEKGIGGALRKRRLSLGLLFAVVLVARVASAAGRPGGVTRLAYLDPGSGSFILQALVAMLAGAIVAINAYWSRIKSFLGLSKTGKDDSKTTGAESSD